MKKVLLAAALCVSTGAAMAQAANFFSATTSINPITGALTVTFDERGLGSGPIIYELTGSGSGVYACINGGGNHPQASNKVGPSPIDVKNPTPISKRRPYCR